MLKIFPAIDRRRIDELREEAAAQEDELVREVVDLADTITQWTLYRRKLAADKRRRKND